ncbi:MAG: hypothetical protein EBU80_11955 [Chitinophagia bacterium]|nr:hypothetical protein [Chitinophagia bacterium]
MQVTRLNFEHTIELALKTAEDLSISVPESIVKFQRAFIFDPEQTYPITIDVDYNVKTWENQPQTLEITPRGLGVVSLVTRRSGAMKNFVKVVDCKHPNQ